MSILAALRIRTIRKLSQLQLSGKLTSLLRHPLALNTLRIFSGNFLVQLISFFTLPVFARIYAPENYGLWGIFIFTSGLAAAVACLRYELAVMIPANDRAAAIIVRIAKTNNLLMLIIVAALVLIFRQPLLQLFNLHQNSWLLVLLPFHVYQTGYNTLMAQWCSRKKMFRFLSSVRVVQMLSNIALSFLMGYFLKWTFTGLILSTVISVLAGNIIYMIYTKVSMVSGFIFKKEAYIKYMSRYKSFLVYSSPLAILNYFTSNILNYLLQVNFGTAILGLYTNASRLVNTPFSMISSAFSPVFYQYFSRSNSKVKVMLVSFVVLLVLFTCMLLPFIFWGEELITWYLGNSWTESAKFIRVLSLVTILSFSMGSVSTVFSFLQSENIVLLWQALYLCLILVIFMMLKNNFQLAMWMYSITGAVAYLILFIIGFRKVSRITV